MAAQTPYVLQRMNASPRARSAFTLIELLVVMAVVAILATIAIPSLTRVQERARAVQDLNNLRQIGLATQMYLNDHDGVLFVATSSDPANPSATWMTLLHPKYLPAWKIFQSPFDTRTATETDPAPISYGLNGNGVAGISADRIARPSSFILLGSAQNDLAQVSYSGLSTTGSGGVAVYKAVSNGKTAKGGTHNNRSRINALFADLHTENILWNTFISDTDTNPCYRWDVLGKP